MIDQLYNPNVLKYIPIDGLLNLACCSHEMTHLVNDTIMNMDLLHWHSAWMTFLKRCLHKVTVIKVCTNKLMKYDKSVNTVERLNYLTETLLMVEQYVTKHINQTVCDIVCDRLTFKKLFWDLTQNPSYDY